MTSYKVDDVMFAIFFSSDLSASLRQASQLSIYIYTYICTTRARQLEIYSGPPIQCTYMYVQAIRSMMIMMMMMIRTVALVMFAASLIMLMLAVSLIIVIVDCTL